MVLIVTRGTLSRRESLGVLWGRRYEEGREIRARQIAERKASGAPLVDESGEEDRPLEPLPPYEEVRSEREASWDAVQVVFRYVGMDDYTRTKAAYLDALNRDVVDAPGELSTRVAREGEARDIARGFVARAVAEVAGLTSCSREGIAFAAARGEDLCQETVDALSDAGLLTPLYVCALDAQRLSRGNGAGSLWSPPPT